MDLIQGSYTISRQDYLEAHDEHVGAFAATATRVFGWFSLGLGLLIAIFERHAYGYVTFFSVSGLWSIFGQHFVMARWYKRDFSSPKRVDVAISERGISFVSEGADFNGQWKTFVGHSESKNLFLLYPSARIFYILPKSAFASDGMAELHRLLNQNVQPRRLGWLRRPWQFSVLIAILVAMFLILAVFAFNNNPVTPRRFVYSAER